MVRLRPEAGGFQILKFQIPFQSHYGAIAIANPGGTTGTRFGFNPTMVRLRLVGFLLGVVLGLVMFQSHYGAIATEQLLSKLLHAPCFNPTMVRLRLSAFYYEIYETLEFQSHYGAIATVRDGLYGCGVLSFQSHYGAIATWVTKTLRASSKNFNPTMVRLRPSGY